MVEKSRVKKIAEELVRFGRQAKQGSTLGFSDEIQDLVAAVGASSLSKDLDFKQALTMARELSKKELSNDWQESPVTSFAGQVVGGIPLGLTKQALSAANWIRGGSKLAGAGKGAAVGAGYGSLAGMGAGDDTLSGRASGFALGGAAGGALGGLTSPLARMGKPHSAVDYREVTKKTAKGFPNKAQQELARQLSARPDLPQQLSRAEQMAGASQRTGIPLTLAETIAQSSSDPLLAQQAVISGNPMTAGRMAQMYAARSGTPQQTGQIQQQLSRVAQQIDPSVSSYDDAAGSLIGAAQQGQRDITRRLVSQAKPLYEAAYQKTVPDDVLQNPLISSALKRVRGNPVYAQEIGNAGDNSIAVLDAVKRSLDDMAEAASRQGSRNESRLINQARDQLLTAMDTASPEYAQARQIYSGNPTALQMRESLGNLAGIDPMDVKSVNRALYSGTQQNAEMAAQALGDKAPTAAAARIYEAMDTLRNDPVNIASRIAPDARTRDMIRTYGGGAVDETLDVINQAKLGERMRHGSPTQPRIEAEKGLAGAAVNTAVDVKTGGTTAIMRKVGQALGRGSEQIDPQFYADMADLMLTDKGMDLLRRVASGQQAAIQELNTIGLPSLIANKAAVNQSIPLGRAAISGMVQSNSYQQQIQSRPAVQDDFSDIESILKNQPAVRSDFSDIERILQGG